jgi:hypothetical protein
VVWALTVACWWVFCSLFPAQRDLLRLSPLAPKLAACVEAGWLVRGAPGQLLAGGLRPMGPLTKGQFSLPQYGFRFLHDALPAHHAYCLRVFPRKGDPD